MTTDPDPLPIEYAGPMRRATAGVVPTTQGAVREMVRLILSTGLWAFAALFLVGGSLTLLVLGTGPVLVFPGLVAITLFVPVLAAAARAVRRRRADAVLGYLDQAVRLNLPLDRLLAAAAASEHGRLAERLLDLRSNLECGLTVADALSVAVPELSPRSVGRVAYGESTGRLPQTLTRLVQDDVRRSAEAPEARAFAAWYPPVLVMVAGGVVGLIWIFVLPKYVQIFHDFSRLGGGADARQPLPLPVLTQWVVASGDTVLEAAAVLAVGLLVALGLRLREAIGGDGPSWLLHGPRDRLLWYLPVVGRFHRDRNLADLCAALADAAEQGLPLDAALARTGQLDLNAVLRRRVARWSGGLAGGQDPVTAARASGLPRLVAGLLACVPPADAPAALRFAARFYAGRHAVRRQVLAAAYLPVVTVLIGGLVALVALSMFLPLRDLIDRLQPYRGGM